MTLDSLPTAVPDFVPNQILSEAQLNGLRDYLDGQTRLGRLRTAGQGIACGLRVRRGSAGGHLALVVSGGYGITSDGYIIESGADADDGDLTFADETYTRVAPYTDPVLAPEGGPSYPPWRSGSSQVGLLRLLRPSEGSGTGRALTEADLGAFDVALYLEQVPEDLDGCFISSCDQLGRRLRFTVRALLVPTSARLSGSQPAVPNAPPMRPRLPRPSGDGPWSDLGSAEDLRKVVQRSAEVGLGRIREAVEEGLARYGGPLGLPSGGLTRAIEQAQGLAERAPLHAWDHALHVADAVSAVHQAACRAVASCGRPSGYARHLMLGRPGGGARHLFLPAAPIHTPAADRARRLFDRLVVLAGSFSGEPEAEDITATASRSSRDPLGSRAIPAAYDPEKLVPLWSEDPCSDHLIRHVGRAFTPDGKEVTSDEKGGDYADPSFIRIEGHLGMGIEQAVDAIERLRQQHGLDLTLAVAHFSGAPSLESDVFVRPFAELTRDHPGLMPRSGVEPGGTFVLVADDDRVVADLSLRCCLGRALAEPITTARLTVVVHHAVTDNPIQGVRVEVEFTADGSPVTRDATTDADGRVSFDDIEAGVVLALRVSRANYRTRSTTLVLAAGESATERIDLDPIPPASRGQAQVIMCPTLASAVSHVEIQGQRAIEVAGGSSGVVDLDAGRRIVVVHSVRGVIKPVEAEVTFEPDVLTTLFISVSARSGKLAVIPGQLPTVGGLRVYNSMRKEPSVSVFLESDRQSTALATDLAMGEVSELIQDFGDLYNRVIRLSSPETTARFRLPKQPEGSLALVLCDDSVLMVGSKGEEVAALPIYSRDIVPIYPGARGMLEKVGSAKLDRTYGTRYTQRLGAVETAGKTAGVGSTATFKNANEFVSETSARADIGAEELTQQYTETMDLLLRTTENAQGANREAYLALAEAVEHSYRDRLTLYPDGGVKAAEAALEATGPKLESIGLAAGAGWEGATLVKEFGGLVTLR